MSAPTVEPVRVVSDGERLTVTFSDGTTTVVRQAVAGVYSSPTYQMRDGRLHVAR
ncbi:hypothetical protein [Melissospora conviva]|uniref:hypothetical protein n=1 Tax=Melissospora conviva TaxID=3388432 RepID=UPI003C155269